MYIMNINAPSEFTSDSNVDWRSGDEFIIQSTFDSVGLTFNIPYDMDNNYIQSVRNSVIEFNSLVLPCQGLSI